MRRKRSGSFSSEEERIGKVIRKERLARGWSQADLSARLDAIGWPLHQTTISTIEAGRQAIRVADMHAFANAFGMPDVLSFMPAGEERDRLAAASRATEEARGELLAAGARYAEALSSVARLRGLADAIEETSEA